jgi:hypothetical protein
LLSLSLVLLTYVGISASSLVKVVQYLAAQSGATSYVQSFRTLQPVFTSF